MIHANKFEWPASSVEEQLAIARNATPEDLRLLARCYDWSTDPETVLGWIMAQKGLDLYTALIVFFNGAPERFNYLARKEVPEVHRGAAWVLDNICLRINSGCYHVRPGRVAEVRAQLKEWLGHQVTDRVTGRQGRWILDEDIVGCLLMGAP